MPSIERKELYLSATCLFYLSISQKQFSLKPRKTVRNKFEECFSIIIELISTDESYS